MIESVLEVEGVQLMITPLTIIESLLLALCVNCIMLFS
jgi:hypothetical protein